MNKYFLLSLLFIFSISFISSVQICQIYDDFSSGSLNTSKWEVRQDIEGQPLMDEYNVLLENGNYVFHTGQNTSGDKRTYLVPKYKFGVGDILEYDVNMSFGANVNLLVGGTCNRCAFGIIPSSTGYHHVEVIFNENQISVEVDNTFLGNAPIGSTEHVHDLYVGAMFGNHIDFDNFTLCSEELGPPAPSLEERIAELENKTAVLEIKVNELENRTSLLESLVDKIVEFIGRLPEGLKKSWSE